MLALGILKKSTKLTIISNFIANKAVFNERCRTLTHFRGLMSFGVSWDITDIYAQLNGMELYTLASVMPLALFGLVPAELSLWWRRLAFVTGMC